MYESPENKKWDLLTRAVETNDATLLDEALSMTDARDLPYFYQRACGEAIRGESMAVLSCLIDHGASVKHLESTSITKYRDLPSSETLEYLLDHGWDINWRGSGRPFMWSMVSNTDMIAWCLEHGASVHPNNQEWERYGVTMSARHCDPILESVGGSGNVATYKLLRSKGAPLGQRTLHRAVERAAVGIRAPVDSEVDTEQHRKDRAEYTERMAMVGHLLDVVKVDVDTPDRAPGCTKGMSSAWGTPISYIPGAGMPERDSRELTWLLLDRGADPAPALEVAKEMDNTLFAENVEAWKAQNPGGPAKAKGSGRSCCVQ
jgi:hypothetical protein